MLTKSNEPGTQVVSETCLFPKRTGASKNAKEQSELHKATAETAAETTAEATAETTAEATVQATAEATAENAEWSP